MTAPADPGLRVAFWTVSGVIAAVAVALGAILLSLPAAPPPAAAAPSGPEREDLRQDETEPAVFGSVHPVEPPASTGWRPPAERPTFPGKILGFADLAAACDVHAREFLCLLNVPGEPVPGGGVRRVAEQVDWEMRAVDWADKVSVRARSGLDLWSVQLAPPRGAPWRTGLFTRASSTRSADIPGFEPRPYLWVTGPGACRGDSAGGRFLVRDLPADLAAPGQRPARLAVDFETHCDGWSMVGRLAIGQ
jgi:hypothetical protein